MAQPAADRYVAKGLQPLGRDGTEQQVVLEQLGSRGQLTIGPRVFWPGSDRGFCAPPARVYDGRKGDGVGLMSGMTCRPFRL